MVKLKRKTYGTANIRLIESAVKVFGNCGFDGATTRKIAADAGANLAVIKYYFKDKRGLYLAVINHILDSCKEQMDNAFDEVLLAAQNPKLSKEMAENVLLKFASKYLAVLLNDKDPPEFSQIISREFLDPSEAFEDIYKSFVLPVHEAVTIIIAKIINKDPTQRETIMACHAVMMHLFGFEHSKVMLLRRLGAKKFYQKDIKQIEEISLAHIKAILNSY